MATDKPRAQLVVEAARDYITRKIMPQESMISIPVPARHDGRLQAVMFVTTTIRVLDMSNRWVYRPPIKVTVDWEDLRVLGYEVVPDVPQMDQDQPVGLLFQPEFAGRPTGELSDRIWSVLTEIYSLLDRVGPLFPRPDLNSGEIALVGRLESALRRWIPINLWLLYLDLNPDFFEWMLGVQAPAPVCPSCGATNPTESRFCHMCGTSLRDP